MEVFNYAPCYMNAQFAHCNCLFGPAGGLAPVYSNSAPLAVQVEYPDHSWEAWNFVAHRNKEFWNDLSRNAHLDVVRRVSLALVLSQLEAQCHVAKLDDWYNVTTSTNLLFTPLCMAFGSVAKCLAIVYPHHPWDQHKLAERHSVLVQRSLREAVDKLVP